MIKYVCLWCKSRFDEMPQNEICPHCGYPHIKQFRLSVEDNSHKAILIKIGNAETINFIRGGSIWFNSPKKYQTFTGDGSGAISDIAECAYEYIKVIDKNTLPYRQGEIIDYNNRKFQIISINAAKLVYDDPYQSAYRLLCMYCLHISNDEIIQTPDEKIRMFGDCFSLVDVNKLIEKLTPVLSSENISFYPTNVTYCTNNYEGAYNPTFKDAGRFSYQNEYRMILKSDDFLKKDELEPYKISVSGLTFDDCFSIPYPIDYLFNSVTLTELKESIEKDE